MDAFVKRRFELNNQTDISLSKYFYYLTVESDGYEKLTYNKRD